jgi:ribosome-binding factor A
MKKSIFADVSHRDTRELVAQLGPEDGIDPRDEAKRRHRARREGRPGEGHALHKQEQFFSQVQGAIEAALQTAAEPILNSLTVQEVVQHGGSLAVVVTPQETGAPVDLLEVSRTLEQAASMLRREVAAATTRKETPHLRFVVLPAGAEKVAE